MIVVTHKTFDKQFKKLPKAQVRQFETRITLFKSNPSHPQLRDHALTGEFRGMRSFSVSGDIRVIYVRKGKAVILLVQIGTHSELYG